MVDLVVTATSVNHTSGPKITLDAGETITAGQCVYKKASDSKAWKAQADGTAAEAAAVGIALNGGAAEQPIVIQSGGVINPGATVAVGIVYCVSAAAGGIAPIADIVATNYVSILGIGTTASAIDMGPKHNSGVQEA